ncbi:MAG: YkvA family protein [Pseudomonadales bacterium]
MSLRITFELEEQDLRYFRTQMKKAMGALQKTSEEEIIAEARKLVGKVRKSRAPAFVKQRLEPMQHLIDMLQDPEWAEEFDNKEREEVVTALRYFANPEDIIPDSVPVLGFIDDAIMMELVIKELEHVIAAFRDFVRYRDEERARNRNPNVTRKQYLEAKRRQLYRRMRNRRRGARATGRGRAIRLF